mgnify:CR=1 FL=1
MELGQSSYPRRKTRQIALGDVLVGGDAPISVQSMTTTKTADVDGTLQQVYDLAMAGADIVRCTCNEVEAAEGLARIVPRSPVPIVADIHHQYRMALAALEAGVQCLRLNPGNIRKPAHIKAVAQEAKDRGVPIRIGVNGGSLDPALYAKYGGKVTPEAMVESAQQEIAYFDEVGFEDIKISVKASSVPLMIEAYRQLSDATDHPLHLGVTEAGPLPGGLLKATAGIATLLAEGIGDTIRYSLTADPVEEARAGRQLLEALGLRERKSVDLIACPSCGRAEVDVIGHRGEPWTRAQPLHARIVGRDEGGSERLARWVRAGGLLITLDAGTEWLASEALDLARVQVLRDTVREGGDGFEVNVSVPGAFVNAVGDTLSPIMAGVPRELPVLVFSSRVLTAPDDVGPGEVVIRYAAEEDLRAAGYLWPEAPAPPPGARARSGSSTTRRWPRSRRSSWGCCRS